MTEEEAAGFVGKENIGTWNEIVHAITILLLKNNLTWHAVNHHDFGPNHVGWSRVVTESYKARKYYPIEGVRHPKFSWKQAAAGSRGPGGRQNL